MNILLVTQYFPPEIGAPQARLSEFARAWADAGHDVTVLTGMPNHPTGVVPPEYRGARFRSEQVDGYRVLRTWLYATPNEGFARKVLSHITFMVTAVLFGLPRVTRPDVVVVSSPTFFSILSAWIIAKVRGARLVVEVRDLWPAIFVELGVLTNPTIIRVLERLELAAYRAADAVVVVSEGFKGHIAARGIAENKIHTIRNGVDLQRFVTGTPRDETVRRRLGAGPDDVLVLYIGAHGISHALGSVLLAAELVDDPRLRFAFVGEGAAKAALVEQVGELGLGDRVTMLPGVAREDVPAILTAADICLAPLRDVPLFETFIPSKIFEYLGSGKAVVGSLRGESAAILGEAGAAVVPPEDADALARELQRLAGDAPARARMGSEGRAYVEREFDRLELANRYLGLLAEVTA